MIIGTILTAFKTAIDYISKPFSKKYLDHPKLTIILTRAGGGKSPMGFVRDPESIQEDGSLLVTPDSIQISRVHSKFNMTIRNNGEHQAYNIDLLSPRPDQVWVELEPKKIDYFKPIPVNSSESFLWTVTQIYTGKGADAAELAQRGLDYFRKNKIVLEYANVKETRFYTVFDFSKPEKERNEFFRKNPLHIKS
jgi:hypothetical protein